MVQIDKFLIFLVCFNLYFCFIRFDHHEDDSTENSKPINHINFEEFDKIMLNSEFSKAWKRFKETGETESISDKSIDNIYLKNKLNENIFSEDNNDNDTCLLSKEKTIEILQKLGEHNDNPSDEVRFIFGNCNPVILIPGMLSTKLQIKVKCNKLFNEEVDIYKKIKFYCGEDVCSDTEKEEEEYNFFISAMGPFSVTDIEAKNKYSGCLGYFLTFFNSKNACAPSDENKDESICHFSKNIKVGYYGSNTDSQSRGKCGLNAIQNVVMSIDAMDERVNQGMLRSFGPFIEHLEKKGYKPGFSLAGIPNDYRQFISLNNFTMTAFRYQVNKLYENTGKKVVLIGHSHGTVTFYNNLVYKKNKDIIPKIKKFIAVGPPFAGSSELIDVFFKTGNKYQKTINLGGADINAGFDEFGFGMAINKLPLAFELRPLPIIGDLFTKKGYEIFAEAIKERFFLEKKCGHTKCDDYIIKKYSTKFNSLFADYFPLLTDDECKFETDLKDRNGFFDRKCLMEMRNIFDCPMIIEETRDENGKLPADFDSYCGKTDNNLFFQKKCDNSNKQCIDQTFSKKVSYPLKEQNEAFKYFQKKWEERNYSKIYGSSSNYYESEEIYRAAPQKQIDYFQNNSFIKELPPPLVDTDIVYSTYIPSYSAFIFDKNDWSKNFNVQKKGGDGVVTNWSPIISGLKWIYDTKKYNLKNKIRLVEYCSRLAKNSKYAYDPKNANQKFAALPCTCIDKDNKYMNRDCDHGVIIKDPSFFSYVDSIINDSNINDLEQKRKAYNNYKKNQTVDYEVQCNEEYLKILNNSFKN